MMDELTLKRIEKMMRNVRDTDIKIANMNNKQLHDLINTTDDLALLEKAEQEFIDRQFRQYPDEDIYED